MTKSTPTSSPESVSDDSNRAIKSKPLAVLAGVLLVPYVVIAFGVWYGAGFSRSLEAFIYVGALFAIIPALTLGSVGMLAKTLVWQAGALIGLVIIIVVHFAWLGSFSGPDPSGQVVLAVHASATLFVILALSVLLRRPRRFTASYAGLVVFALLLPAAFAIMLPFRDMTARSKTFSRLCDTAAIKVLEPVRGAKSIAVLPDSFASMARGQPAETRQWSDFLLNQSFLEFVERPATKQSGIAGTAKYERISTVGERVRQRKPGSNAETQYVFEPVEELTAEYEVHSIRLQLESTAERGWGGARIEIRRRSDNRLVAYAQYYWDDTEIRACPQESQSGLFIYHFIAGALGVKNTEVPQ